jgi:Septum formation initiator
MKRRANLKLFVMGLSVIYVGYVLGLQIISEHKLKNEINEQIVVLEGLKDMNQGLQDEVNMSKTDSFMEKLARERLGLIKDGETPVIHNSASKK